MRLIFFFSSRRRHTRYIGDWSSDVCSSDLFGKLLAVVYNTKEYLLPPLLLAIFYAVRGALTRTPPRSEERRVGKECRSRWSADSEKKKRTADCEAARTTHSGNGCKGGRSTE